MLTIDILVLQYATLSLNIFYEHMSNNVIICMGFEAEFNPFVVNLTFGIVL